MEWERIRQVPSRDEADPCRDSQASTRGGGRQCGEADKSRGSRPPRKKKTLLDHAKEQREKAGGREETAGDREDAKEDDSPKR